MAMTIIHSGGGSASPVFTAAGFGRGMRAAAPFLVSNGAAGMVMGLAYQGLGLTLVSAVLFSLVVYSGTAQAVTLGLWRFPLPVVAMITACIATNARYLVMGAHLRQLFSGLPRRRVLPTLLLLADASWLMTTADAERNGADAGYFLGSSVPMAVGWIGGTALAYVLPIKPTGVIAVAASLIPLAFIVTLLPGQWRGARMWLPWSISAAAALVTAQFVGSSWAMLIGGALGTGVSFLQGDDA
jgi:predicted branched-subunit amino acid permease